FLPLSSPHPPYTAPQGFHNMYDPAKLPPLRPIGLPRKPNFYEAIRNYYHLGPLGEDVFRKIQAVYLGKISYTDWLLGEMLEAIERTGHVDDTAVFLFSDHGDWAGDYGLVEKWPSALDDVLTHVPLVLRLPGGAQNHVSKEIVELFDVMATSLALAGIEARHTHFARSLMPQLHGSPGDPGRAAFSEGGYNIYEPQCFEPADLKPGEIYYPKEKLEADHPETVSRAAMIKTSAHKLVLRPGGQSELYDVAKDPRELHNVYGDRSYAGAQEDLVARLLQWYVLTADVAPPDKDPRGSPPYYPTPHFKQDDWQKKILD
ncbi:MAG: sulfatase-like hydrolase/transferase, partial [Terriglobia bacterium]